MIERKPFRVMIEVSHLGTRPSALRKPLTSNNIGATRAVCKLPWMYTHTRCPHKGSANTSRNVAKVGRGDGVIWGQEHRDLRPPHNNPARLAGLPTSHTPLHAAGSQYIATPYPEIVESNPQLHILFL